MDTFEVLELLEKTSSKTEKTRILKDNLHNEELAFLLDAALNFNRKFHIKIFNEDRSPPTSTQPNISFKLLLEKLEAKEITGNEAVKQTEEFFEHCNKLERKWFARVLRKNLRAGVDSTARKAGFDIPKFDVMLAKDAKQCKKLKEVVSGGVYISPKLDGYRCIAVCSHGVVTLYSRNGSVYGNFPSVVESLEKASWSCAFVLDGEIMSDDFNAMQQSAFASERGTTVGDVKYHVFGYIDYDEWITDDFRMKTGERLDQLSQMFGEHGELKDFDNIVEVEQGYVNSVAVCEAMEKKYIGDGYEGAMVLPDIPYYKGKKSNKLLKFKTMQSMDCRVGGMYEGTGKYVGTMGGLNLIQEDGKHCDVGSGFTDEERDYIWQNKEKIVDRIAEIKYQELTPDGIMRFPIFLRWRNDKS